MYNGAVVEGNVKESGNDSIPYEALFTGKNPTVLVKDICHSAMAFLHYLNLDSVEREDSDLNFILPLVVESNGINDVVSVDSADEIDSDDLEEFVNDNGLKVPTYLVGGFAKDYRQGSGKYRKDMDLVMQPELYKKCEEISITEFEGYVNILLGKLFGYDVDLYLDADLTDDFIELRL